MDSIAHPTHLFAYSSEHFCIAGNVHQASTSMMRGLPLLLLLTKAVLCREDLPHCLPLCCLAHTDSNETSSCADVEMVDGSSLSESEACLNAAMEPQCVSGERPRRVTMHADSTLRGRKVAHNLYEVSTCTYRQIDINKFPAAYCNTKSAIKVQLGLPRGFISTFYNVLPSPSSWDPFPIPVSFCPTFVDANRRVTEALVCPRARLKASGTVNALPISQ